MPKVNRNKFDVQKMKEPCRLVINTFSVDYSIVRCISLFNFDKSQLQTVTA